MLAWLEESDECHENRRQVASSSSFVSVFTKFVVNFTGEFVLQFLGADVFYDDF